MSKWHRTDQVPANTSVVATRQDGVPTSSETHALHESAVAAGLQLEWHSRQEDAICLNALSDFPTPTPSSSIPISQKYMQGDVQLAIQHLCSVAQLRQWSDKWIVPNDPSILRALADLGDTDAFFCYFSFRV